MSKMETEKGLRCCIHCGVELTEENWYLFCKKRHQHLCKACRLFQSLQSRKKHWEPFLKAYAKYLRENTKTSSLYAGVVFCPKCGKKGYKYYQVRLNINTGNSQTYTRIRHSHGRPTIVDGYCYLGMGKL
jgi:hypothetical protein